MKKILINSKEEMAILAKEIAASSKVGDVICLDGTLGAGKSFFAKHFINSLQSEVSEVLSPTFNIVCSYETPKCEVFHFDLYRLKSANELENIGFFDSIREGICLIEWPEIAEKFLPQSSIKISIKILNDETLNGEGREILISN